MGCRMHVYLKVGIADEPCRYRMMKQVCDECKVNTSTYKVEYLKRFETFCSVYARFRWEMCTNVGKLKYCALLVVELCSF